jgi:hypothetical protein
VLDHPALDVAIGLVFLYVVLALAVVTSAEPLRRTTEAAPTSR